MQSQQFRNSYQVPLVVFNRLGRPRFDISQEQLVYLRSLSFTWSQIAAILGVSRMTLYRRRAEFGMLMSPSQVISDEQLHSMVTEMHSFQPGLGEVMIWVILYRVSCYTYKITVCYQKYRSASYSTTMERKPINMPSLLCARA